MIDPSPLLPSVGPGVEGRNAAYLARCARETGNWHAYFVRMVHFNGRSATLTADDLKAIYARQGGRCALTGVELTCIRGKRIGDAPENASLDRLKPGGPYTRDNVQLVCQAVNSFRGRLSVEEYVNWCARVVRHSGSVHGLN
jgi:hypothetical protein